MNPQDFSDWSYDGSSTGQAEGNNSDCILRHVRICSKPPLLAPKSSLHAQVALERGCEQLQLEQQLISRVRKTAAEQNAQ